MITCQLKTILDYASDPDYTRQCGLSKLFVFSARQCLCCGNHTLFPFSQVLLHCLCHIAWPIYIAPMSTSCPNIIICQVSTPLGVSKFEIHKTDLPYVWTSREREKYCRKSNCQKKPEETKRDSVWNKVMNFIETRRCQEFAPSTVFNN